MVLKLGCWIGTLCISPLLLLAASVPAEGQTSRPPEGRWATARLSQPRLHPAVAVVGTRALFAGGESEVVDIYDAATGQWTTSRPPHVGPIALAVTVGSGMLVVWSSGPQPGMPVRAAVYDGTTGRWHDTGLLPRVLSPWRQSATAVGPFGLVMGQAVIPPATSPTAVPVTADLPVAVDLYNSATGQWTSATAPTMNVGAAIATVGTTAIFAGGLPGCTLLRCLNPASDAVVLFDSSRQQWSSARLAEPRTDAAATTVGSKALFAGGLTTGSVATDVRGSDVVDIYDAVAARWSTARLSQARSGLVAASVGTRALFASGAVDSGGPNARPSDVVDIYDAATGQWSTARLSQPRLSPAAAVVGTRVLFAGGLVGWWGGPDARASDVVDIYDSATGQWSTAHLSQARTGLVSAVVGGQVLFAGGGIGPDGAQASDVVDLYLSAPAGPVPAPALAHDERYFALTGYRIDQDPAWAFFQAHGGVATFGYPVSRTFGFLGCPVQVFQRLVLQLCPGREPALLNLLDPELLPYTHINGSSFPSPDEQLKAATPRVADPDYARAMLDFVRAATPDSFEGQPVQFGRTFFDTGGLEVWGAPISRPRREPSNPDFVYQRFQRGILHYSGSQQATQAILLADYLKGLLRGRDLPSDLRQEAHGSRYFAQYCPGAPGWLCRPDELPGTDLTFAFDQG
jgi:hypothetical protein